MNEALLKQIKTSIHDSRVKVDNKLNKKISIEGDSELLNQHNLITNKLLKLAYGNTYKILIGSIKETSKYLKKVNLDNPFGQNMIGNLLNIDVDANYSSPTTWLYVCLNNMALELFLFDVLFDKIDEIEKDFIDMMNSNSVENISACNKVSLLTQMEALRQIKLSALTLYECYAFILKNPQIKDFYIKWANYKKMQLSKSRIKINTDYPENIISRINSL